MRLAIFQLSAWKLTKWQDLGDDLFGSSVKTWFEIIAAQCAKHDYPPRCATQCMHSVKDVKAGHGRGVHSYLHTYAHAYMNTYFNRERMHAYSDIHTYIYIYTYIHTYIHT